MVTTRGGADTSSPQVSSVTRSGRKRFIDDSATSTPTRNVKKRRSSAEEETIKLDLTKDSSDSAQSAISVSTPVRAKGRGSPPKNTKLDQDDVLETPIARGKKDLTAPESVDATPQKDESVYGTPAGDDTPSVYATPATNLHPTLRGSAQPTPGSVTPKPRNRAARSTPSKPSRLISSQTADEDNEESTPKAAEPAPTFKNTHIRFGSEDPPAIPEPVPDLRAKPDIPPSTAEDEEGSDDEAPEAVTAMSAREQTRAAEQDAAKAVEKREAEVKRKRQEHVARLKEQAAAARKRKQNQEPRELPAADAASSATIQASDPAALHKLSRASKPAYDLNNIPIFLPDDLLATAPAVRPATPEFEDGSAAQADAALRKKQKLNKHLKFLDKMPAKDVKKGPVKVRVLEKGNKFLPPKAMGSGSRNARDQWLQGRKVKETKKGSFGGLERKKTGGGFLRK